MSRASGAGQARAAFGLVPEPSGKGGQTPWLRVLHVFEIYQAKDSDIL